MILLFWAASLYLAFILGWRLKEWQDKKIWSSYWKKENNGIFGKGD